MTALLVAVMLAVWLTQERARIREALDAVNRRMR